MNFINGTELAADQDNVISDYNKRKNIPQSKAQEYRDNIWLKSSYFLAPSNLTIRGFCLIDVIEGCPAHCEEIISILEKLTYKKWYTRELRLWACGYSYFSYSMSALELWINKFKDPQFFGSEHDKYLPFINTIQLMVKEIEDGVIATSYLNTNDGLLYPAPYNDLRNEPLATKYQVERIPTLWDIKPIKMTVEAGILKYYYTPSPVGMNGHISLKESCVSIIDNIPTPFKFYEGYDKKYQSSVDEWKDLLSPKRIVSIIS